MIYNLVEYLTVQLAALVFVANGWSADSPAESVVVIQSPGDPKHFYPRTDWTVQIMSRSLDAVTAKENIDSVYALLKNKWNVLLPEVTVRSTVYSEVQTYQISPLQTPAYVGADDKNLEAWSFNLTIVTN